ncbi:hypothetical protein [Paraburkholderia sp. GAS42]|uniref:hypothetical protein n=1 Tax=Paraburkholderia sp. GAS42 TaxID=3035135 RepID=UPI003D1F7327
MNTAETRQAIHETLEQIRTVPDALMRARDFGDKAHSQEHVIRQLVDDMNARIDAVQAAALTMVVAEPESASGA